MEASSGPRALSVGQMTAPCLLVEVEISIGAPSVPSQNSSEPARCAWLLVRHHTEPIGSIVVELPPEGLSTEQLALVIQEELGVKVATNSGGGVKEESSEPMFLSSRQEVLRFAPKMTVIVCTHERPEGLETCLQSLISQEYPNYSILVVDNAPSTKRTKAVVDRFTASSIGYVVEPQKGLSWARTKAIRTVTEGILAWIDDDEIADPHWLAELARGFYNHPEADAVSGVMVPGELETWAQVLFEQYGGFNMHRGFTPALFSPDTARIQSPFYPLPLFGAGGNMAVRSTGLARIGGFDVALGAGGRCMAGEDTRLFTDLLCTGGTVVYQPTAITRHFHRRRMEDLHIQMFGYGVGLTAFYMSLVVSRPQSILQLIRLLPIALRELFTRQSLQTGDLPSNFPTELIRTKRRGMLLGPIFYLRSRVETARIARKK